MYKIFAFLSFLLLNSKYLSAQQYSCPSLNGQYGTNVLFQRVNTQIISYRTVKDYTGKEIKLHADIYQGINSWTTSQKKTRPLIVLFHGGGFKSGARNTGIMSVIASYYAQRGYVVVSADYRMGWNDADKTLLCGGGTQKDYLDAQYRAMQDERYLTQYLKSQSNAIGFDTNKIFLFGISSGATLVCSRLEDEWISLNDERSSRLGPLEIVDGQMPYSTSVAGIISFAGANLSPQVQEGYEIPIIFFHGTCDNAVPFEEQYLASCSNMGYYYGPKILSDKLNEKGICHKNIIYCGFGHDLAAQGDVGNVIPWALQDVFERSISFMQEVMCNDCTSGQLVANASPYVKGASNCTSLSQYAYCDFSISPETNSIVLTPNLFYDDFTIYLNSIFESDEKLLLRVYNMQGQMIQEHHLSVPHGVGSIKMQLTPFEKGIYLYQIIDGKKVWSSGKLWRP